MDWGKSVRLYTAAPQIAHPVSHQEEFCQWHWEMQTFWSQKSTLELGKDTARPGTDTRVPQLVAQTGGILGMETLPASCFSLTQSQAMHPYRLWTSLNVAHSAICPANSKV